MTNKLVVAFFLVASIITIGFLLRLAGYAVDSKKFSPAGMVDGSLAKCPNSPNCISSELHEDDKHSVRAITLSSNLKKNPWPLVKEIVEIMGGFIVVEEKDYLAANFRSKTFKFVDDFELRWDELAGVLHVRSASRVGYSDLGENKRRIAEFKSRLFTLDKNRSEAQ